MFLGKKPALTGLKCHSTTNCLSDIAMRVYHWLFTDLPDSCHFCWLAFTTCFTQLADPFQRQVLVHRKKSSKRPQTNMLSCIIHLLAKPCQLCWMWTPLIQKCQLQQLKCAAYVKVKCDSNNVADVITSTKQCTYFLTS